MKQTKLWLATIATLLCSLTASAHDFEVDGIYYNITSSTDLAVAVTFKGSSYYQYSYEYTGVVTIPTTVTHEGVSYSVTSIGSSAFEGCHSLTFITIPESVTSIGSEAFRGCNSLTFITIPEGVTSIGSYAFSECYSLYKVINNSELSLSKGSSNNGVVAYYAKVIYDKGILTTIDDFQFYTFDGIHSLVNYIGKDTEIELPNSYNGKNYKIGEYAFYGSKSLTSITIPESVTSIGSSAFSNCTGELTINCNIPSVSYSSDSPFYNSGFSKVTIGNNVTSIGSYAFSNCSNLNSVIIGSGLLSIESNAFTTKPKKTIWLTNTPPTGYTNANGAINYVANNQYSNLSNVKVYPYLSSMFEVDGVKYVPVSPAERTCDAIDCAYNSSASTIDVNETVSFRGIAMTVKTVMPYTFYANNYIEEVSVSNKGVVGYYAFYNCDNILSVELSNESTVGDAAFYDCDGITHVVASNKGNINKSAFYNCDGIQRVELSNEGNVCEDAFYDCDGITHIVASNKGNVERYAFYSCDGLKTLKISNVGYVGDNAFRGCRALETAFVTNTGTVNSHAFYDCVSLKMVTLGNKVASLGDEVFRECTSLQKVVIPDSVKSVGAYCFYGCTTMKSAVIGNGLTNVKEYTFANCTGLESVKVGNGVTSISSYAFSACSSLNDVEIGSNVATINNYAFQNCSSLPAITIPQAVTTIGDNVFAGCSSLADVIIADRTKPLALGSNGSSSLFVDCPLDSVYIGGKITYSTTSSKGYSPFYRNISLRTVVITDREEQVYDNEFYGCTSLENVSIGNGVKSIGDYAFSGCSSLEGFSFGSNMESIGAEAFSDCTNLTSLTSHAAVPPTCGTQALDDINKWNCVLGVPLGNAEAYYAADQWKDFFFIDAVVEVDHYILTYVVDGEVIHTEVLKHKDEVTMLAEPTKMGYTFSGWDKTLTTMPAEDVTISGTFTMQPVENLIIRDDERVLVLDEEVECNTVTYVRPFGDTEWQALYVPFEIPYENICEAFEVAYLNNVRQYDHDDDGVKDETVIEAFKMKEGVLEANYPYLIRAKEAGEKQVVLPGAALYTTEEVSLDCASIFDTYTFTGTYSSLSSAELPQGEGYYTLVNGEWQPVTEDVTLGAFRFYLKVDSRSGAPVAEARSIRMRIVGENGEDDVTGISNSEIINQNSEIIYDLQGRRIAQLTKGLNIVKMKDGSVKKVLVK